MLVIAPAVTPMDLLIFNIQATVFDMEMLGWSSIKPKHQNFNLPATP